jgi:proline iminopeptidase
MKKWLIPFVLFAYLSATGQHPNKEGFKQVNGVELYYEDMGAGQPIVVVHGGPGLDAGYFLPGLDLLSKKYRLISYDQRGTGRSKGPLDTLMLTVDQYIEDIEGLRQAFQIEKMHLMGHSFGGLLALLYASKYPDHLYSLILVGSGAKDTISFPEQNRTVEKRTSKEDTDSINKMVAAGYFNTKEGRSKLFPILWKPYVYNKKYIASIKTSICDSFLLVNSRVGKSLERSNLWSNLNERLIKLKLPALIIHGDYDPVPLSAAETNRNILKRSQLVVLKNCGHFPFIEQQEIFTNTVDGFLRLISSH